MPARTKYLLRNLQVVVLQLLILNGVVLLTRAQSKLVAPAASSSGNCDGSQFKCGSSGECVGKKLVCDGKNGKFLLLL